ncbi:MAG: plasmid recombination protein [Lachnospiraceae bacterium]|nr:plasmid recombination protein [Lachnospiraceae bacterium]
MEWHPTNADAERTHLNRELISGKLSRDERINKRIKDAGIKKPRKDQVTALTLIMSASCEDMQRIMNEGKFDDWCRSSIKWAQNTHGEENVVSAVLHMDEKTPHLHVTVVPIVQGMSKDQIYREKKAREAEEKGIEQKKKRKYKKKDPDAPRLCAADVMARTKLKEYQTTYANAVSEYGLERGIDGSIAKHVDINDWYRTLVTDVQDLLKEKAKLTSEIEDLTSIKAKAGEAVKNTAKGVGSAIASIGKGIGAGLKEMGTYALPSKARDREKAAEKKAEEATEREKTAKANQRTAEKERDEMKRDRDVAIREKNNFISKYSQEIASIDQKNSQISELQNEKNAISELMEDAASIGLTAHQTWQLYRGEQIEMEGITHPEFKEQPPITPQKSDKWLLKFNQHLLILHDRTWRPLKEWLNIARRSMMQWLREQEPQRQNRGFKR